MAGKILLGHGSGGSMMDRLIRDLFVRYFDNPFLRESSDSAVVPVPGKHLAYTTDSYVVDPLFFPGGNIGTLAVCGTLNDLAVAGAKPLYLTAGFIIEEGFEIAELERIVISMAKEAGKAGVPVVAGDTKVVNKGKCDKIFINTSGVGLVEEKYLHIRNGKNIQPGDKIIVNGTLGDHGIAVLLQREGFRFKADVRSDCASLYPMIKSVLDEYPDVRFMRDATRGGLATVLCEVVRGKPFGINVEEERIPVSKAVGDVCSLLGMDPLYIANEGKAVFIVPADRCEKVFSIIQSTSLGDHSAIIGTVTGENPGRVVMETLSGGKRLLDYLSGEQLPRIC